MAVKRIYVEKKPGFDVEAKAMLADLRENLNMKGLKDVRIINRYDVEGITDEEYAKTTPFGGLIAPGVMSFMSVWAKYLEVDFFGEELLAGKSTKIEWLKPVYANDVLTGKATITNLVTRNAKNGIVEITVYAYNQNGDLVLTNITEAIVKRKL